MGEKAFWCAIGVLLLLAVAASLLRPELAKPENWAKTPTVGVPQARPVCLAPAPKLHKAKPVKVKGKLMSAWTTIDPQPGDANAIGTFVASGTYNGETAYVNSSGWWLWYSSGFWVISSAKGSIDTDSCYTSFGVTLPGDPWGIPGPPSLASPAPTLSELTPPDLGWPYAYWDWWEAPFDAPATPVKPCLATIGAVDYVVFRDGDGTRTGFPMFRLSDNAWDDAANTDTYGFGAYHGSLHDAGDDTHVWLIPGAYRDVATPKFACQKWALVYGGGATLVSSVTLALADLDVSNAIETSTGNVRFILRHGAQVQLCSYVLGAGSYDVVQTWPTVTALPSGYTDLALGGAGQTDHYLHEADGGAVYWFRHCVNGIGQHRLVPYTITDSSCTQLADVLVPEANDGQQTWGNYADIGRMVGDIGSGGTPLAPVDPAGMYWVAGAAGMTRGPFANLERANRRWYLDGTPLRVVGWLCDAYSNVPFVMEIEPIAVSGDLAISYAATLHVAGALATSYGADEVAAGTLAAAWATSYGARLPVTGDLATSYAATRAVTGALAGSYGAGLASAVLVPAPVSFTLEWIRARRGV